MEKIKNVLVKFCPYLINCPYMDNYRRLEWVRYSIYWKAELTPRAGSDFAEVGNKI
jgi:hypothetical protein